MELAPDEFALMRNYILDVCGVAIREEKAYLIRQRLTPLVQAAGCTSFREYYQKFLRAPFSLEREFIISAITTNETSFFRDGHPFETFRNILMPKLGELARTRKERAAFKKGPRIRIWSAGASTGQEPYSIAILIYEYLTIGRYSGLSKEDFEILATDISTVALAKAESGRYNASEISRGVSDPRLNLYFRRMDQDWVIHDEIRSMVDFRLLNIAKPFTGLGVFDLIFCRNVLIYFNDETKSKIFEQFHQILSDEGCLILGSTENTYAVTNRFRSVRQGETLVYYKQ
jgi:chemotaxis protein methyltransferase CheR